jgi:hypothetical protein
MVNMTTSARCHSSQYSIISKANKKDAFIGKEEL